MPAPPHMQHVQTALGAGPVGGGPMASPSGPMGQTGPTMQRPVHRPSGPIPASRGSQKQIDVSGSMSFVPPSRPLGLIAIVLLVDLVLAGSGAFMLAKGLSKSEAASASPNAISGSDAASAPSATAPTATPDAAAAPEPVAAGSGDSAPPAGSGSQTAVQNGSGDPADKPVDKPVDKSAEKPADKPVDKPDKPADKSKTKTKTGGKTKSTTKSSGPVTSPSGPVTSPSGPSGGGESVESQIEALAKRSEAAFDNCRRSAGPVHGDLEVAFRVMGDGTVSNVSVVKNSTSNTELARCLLTKIQKWKVAPHGGAPMSFVRPFNYP
jgi:TonB family protein